MDRRGAHVPGGRFNSFTPKFFGAKETLREEEIEGSVVAGMLPASDPRLQLL
jgi:hypothetical protein